MESRCSIFQTSQMGTGGFSGFSGKTSLAKPPPLEIDEKNFRRAWGKLARTIYVRHHFVKKCNAGTCDIQILD